MKIHKGILRGALAVCLAGLVAAPLPAQAPQTEYEGSAALGLALRRLGTTKRVLMIGAHPDDESTQILSELALGEGAQVAYLSLTRGEGGQNGIGPELQDGLGLLRTEELLAARRLDGARQYFTRAYDYGFSKDADEAFRHWPRDSVLADVVAAVRDFRPDLIVAVFSGTPRDGHGQHQVAGIMAREAYAAAADPGRFPEQLGRGLRPHAAAKLYQALWFRDEGATERLATGELDPLFGRSHYQIAMASRSRHRSQDMGQILTAGPQTSAFKLVSERVPAPDASGLFAGVDTTLSLVAQDANGGAGVGVGARVGEYEALVAGARARFNPLRSGEIVAELARALGLLRASAADVPAGDGAAELRARIAAEEAEAADALWKAAGLVLDVVSVDESVVPGQSVEVTLSLWNGGDRSVRITTLEPRFPDGWTAEPLGALPATVAAGQLVTRAFRVTVAPGAAPSEPYFLRLERSGDLYRWPAASGPVGVPFERAALRGTAAVEVEGVSIASERDASHRGLDKMQGELRRPVRVVPAVAVTLDPPFALLPRSAEGKALPITVRLQGEAPAGIAGAVRPVLPAGWRAEPASIPVRFEQPGEERTVQFTLHPPAQLPEGAVEIPVAFEADDGRRFGRGYALIDYSHIQPRPLYRPARVVVRSLDIQLPTRLSVGYVAGAGDEVPAALAQLGIAVEPLGPADLATGDLSRFDVIVTGIRAYEVRPDLVAHNQRLLDYVRDGGTAIVQYNKYEYTEPGIAPFPLEMARPHGRVTDETAPVTILDPSHAVFTTPNRITAADFDGWLHERGLYFLHEWDARYTPLLAMADPGEDPLRGSLVVAPYGEGRYVYTGLAFFRQLPAGVPGAYRLFANLLALGAK